MGCLAGGAGLKCATGYVSVDALLVELPVKLVSRRSQVRFLLTGFYAEWRGLHKVVFRSLAGRALNARRN